MSDGLSGCEASTRARAAGVAGVAAHPASVSSVAANKIIRIE
jgi:hypothetical protein